MSKGCKCNPYSFIKKNLEGIKLNIYFAFQSTFMNMLKQEHQQDLQHIKQMMERSSRFISLSGLSGIAAGLCACRIAGLVDARDSIRLTDCVLEFHTLGVLDWWQRWVVVIVGGVGVILECVAQRNLA